MSLTVPYAISLARRLVEPDLHFTWMEEFLPPDEYDGYEEVKKAVGNLGFMLTTGEHEYSRFGFKMLIDKKAAHILQPDITWLGGITEARKMMAQAAASDVLVVPHGSSIYSYHLQFAFNNAPVGEFINLSADGCEIKPDFGCTLAREGLKRPYARPESSAAAHRAKNAKEL